MPFLAPHLLHLAWLALIPLALYLFRKRARRVPVSTLLFFRSLAREHRESAWLRQLKRWLSLLLTLLVILLSVLALARPTREVGADAPGAVVLVIDRSASMAARDASGRTRLEEAQDKLHDRVRSLPDGVIVSLVVFDAKARVLLSRSRNHRECLRLLQELKPVPMEGRPDAALVLVRRLAALESRSQVWHAGDVAFEAADGLAYLFLDAALDKGTAVNVGITGFQIRQAPLTRDRYEGFVEVSAAQANPTEVTTSLEVTIAGRLAQLREIDLQPGESASLILPLEGIRGQRLEIRLRTPQDCLGWDDGLAAPLPQARPLVVAWVAEKPDPFTELALASLVEAGRIEMLKGEPAAWPLKDKPDVYVFEHWLPETWPGDRPVIALNPNRSAGPVHVRTLPGRGVPHEGIRSVAPDHAVLFRVSSSRLAVTQTAVLDLTGSLEPLWVAGTEPVLAAGEVNGQRIVATTFSPALSEQLALLPAFPLLLGNALYWCAEASVPLAELRTARTGDIVRESGLIQWTAWNGEGFVEVADEAVGDLAPLGRIGAWQAASGRAGASLLASANETNLRAKSAQASDQQKPSPTALQATSLGNLPRWLLWAVLGILLVESFLFHRKAVY